MFAHEHQHRSVWHAHYFRRIFSNMKARASYSRWLVQAMNQVPVSNEGKGIDTSFRSPTRFIVIIRIMLWGSIIEGSMRSNAIKWWEGRRWYLPSSDFYLLSWSHLMWSALLQFKVYAFVSASLMQIGGDSSLSNWVQWSSSLRIISQNPKMLGGRESLFLLWKGYRWKSRITWGFFQDHLTKRSKVTKPFLM